MGRCELSSVYGIFFKSTRSSQAAPLPNTASYAGTYQTMTSRHDLFYQARYAVRLTQRTARFYRRIQAFGTFMAILGGSGTASLITQAVPIEVGIVGAVMMAIAGAALITIRPADKAAQNESDAKRYLALLAKAPRFTDDEFEIALQEAHQSDCPEIEPLRDVAYNDVVMEYGREDAQVKLSVRQSIFASMA